MHKIINNPKVRQYLIVVIVNLSSICSGMSFNWPSPVLVKLRNVTQTVLPEPLTEEQGSWLVSIGYLVVIFTNSVTFLFMDILGRKRTLILSGVVRVVMTLCFIFGNAVWILLLGRILGAVSDCTTIAVSSVYASEVASKEIRGSLGTLMQIFSSLGTLIMLAIGPFVSYLTLNIVLMVATIVSILPVFLIPVSPYFMFSKGHIDKSTKALVFLRGSPDAAREEINEYTSSLAEMKEKRKGDILKNRTFLKSICIVILIGVGSQASGFNAVSFYLQTILESTHTRLRDEVGSLIIGFIQLGSSFLTAVILDRFGRKPILGFMLALFIIGMFGLGTFFYIRDSTGTVSGVMNYVPLLCLILVVVGNSAGPGSIIFLLAAELFEGPVRAIGISTLLVIVAATNFIINRLFPNLTNGLGPASTYWLFGSIAILFLAFVFIFIPETKGKSFAEIQVALGAKQRVFDEVASQNVCDDIKKIEKV